ncbi:rna-directed dna polymerase from mobile element jockey-like [Limosa lapponica baueri]|uniref:Rna-directed dna polymerase from mobile element jockey-like n=1 Tax=Limosa lapponica baueri TaxID=1758121 RepID=A0A2I0UQP0_LIMLA|nr:rna-directed dna polymerase from mobile element jockey-like [Limosa lapponica baueri]
MECLSLLQEDSKDSACVRCEQAHDLLSLVAELKEEVERLGSIWECEKEIDWWTNTLPSLGKKEQGKAPRGEEDPLPSCHQKGEKGIRPRVTKAHVQGFKLEVKGEGDKTIPNGNEPGGKGPRMGVKLGAQLKCIYTRACSMGNKQDELEAMVQQDSYGIVAFTETWWDYGHSWNAVMNGYKLFRRNRQGRRGGVVAL